jgi:hypothetical protein
VHGDNHEFDFVVAYDNTGFCRDAAYQDLIGDPLTCVRRDIAECGDFGSGFAILQCVSASCDTASDDSDFHRYYRDYRSSVRRSMATPDNSVL